MDPQSNNVMSGVVRTSAKDFFLNLGAIVALYTVVISLLNLLFTIINNVYPQITNSYYYVGSQSISWPVAVLIIFFPIFIFLMWLLEKNYVVEPEKKNLPVRRWLTYITLFIAGIVLAGDLVMVIYYFIDGQDLTAGFLLKALSVLVVTTAVFLYYISEQKGRVNSSNRKMWAIGAGIIVIGSIVWGFSVLGSPRTQRLYKYDAQKVNDLSMLSNAVESYYYRTNALPDSLNQLTQVDYYFNTVDPQSQAPYEYQKTGANTYRVCAEFNLAERTAQSMARPMYNGGAWPHEAGRQCFDRTIAVNNIQPKLPL